MNFAEIADAAILVVLYLLLFLTATPVAIFLLLLWISYIDWIIDSLYAVGRRLRGRNEPKV